MAQAGPRHGGAAFSRQLISKKDELPPPRWREVASEVTSHCCYADVGGLEVRWLRVIGEYAYIRSSPSVEDKLAGLMQTGGLLHAYRREVKDEQGHVWVELTPLMKWRLHIDKDHASRAFTLVDGTPWGAGMLLEEIPKDDWPPPDLAERSGIRWKVLEDHSFRPRDARGRVNPDAAKDKFLCHWDAESRAESSFLSRNPGRPLDWNMGFDDVPCCLAACCMLKGSMPSSVESWLLYHFRIGFQCLYLFFDDPDDPAIPAAQGVAAAVRSPRAVRIYRCSPSWWEQQKSKSRFYRFRHMKWSAPVVDANEQIKDVQSRQQLCVDLAIQDAFLSRIHWLVHIDIDELLYFPQKRYREDAPAWFATLGPEVDMVKFHNHECVPEDVEVSDWFRDVTLFKPAIRYLVLPDDPYQPPDETPPLSDKSDAGGKSDEEDLEEPKKPPKGNAVDEFLKTIAFARSRHTRQLGLNLPDPPRVRRNRQRFERKNKRREAKGLPPLKDPSDSSLPETFTHFIAYANGKCAVRVRTLEDKWGATVADSLPLPCGVHSFMAGVVDGDRGPIPRLRRKRMDGPKDPGVLHYANCGFSYWVKKYQILGRFPDILNGRQNTMRAHLAARDLVLRYDRRDLELYYRMFIMSNLIGELPLLFNRGLVIRIDSARQIVERARLDAAGKISAAT